MRVRWAVRYEIIGPLGFIATCVTGAPEIKPLVRYGYYRWRWLARLAAFWRRGYYQGATTRTTLLGRIKVKSKEQQWGEATARAHDMQQRMYEEAARDQSPFLSLRSGVPITKTGHIIEVRNTGGLLIDRIKT